MTLLYTELCFYYYGEIIMPDSIKNSKVDHTLKELNAHGSFELPIETYTDNCVIFHSLYNHWHDEMEIILIENGMGKIGRAHV